MTIILNQVTCSLCKRRIGDLQWMKQPVSPNHLELCKYDKVNLQ